MAASSACTFASNPVSAQRARTLDEIRTLRGGFQN
jgi:hypothetical protein